MMFCQKYYHVFLAKTITALQQNAGEGFLVHENARSSPQKAR